MHREQQRRGGRERSAESRPGREEPRGLSREGGREASIEIASILAGLDFPATRRDMVRHARDLGSPTVVIAALTDLPERRYSSPRDVTKEIGNFM